MQSISRRAFVGTSVGFVSASLLYGQEGAAAREPILDIHQHTHYHDREDAHLVAHQRAMGVTHTILLPAGTPMETESTHKGRSNGLAARCYGTADCMRVAKANPGYLWGANEVTDLETAPQEIEKWLKQGACIIGEQKFNVECDSVHSQKLYELAASYNVPILLHFQHLTYNLGYDRFHKMLEKYPKTNFIGHAQAFWGNIDKNHDPKQNYPKGKVTTGGNTDRNQSD